MRIVNAAFLIRLYFNKEQLRQNAITAGCARWLYNSMLDLQNKRYENEPTSKALSAYSMNYILAQLKSEFPWLKDADSTALINTNANLSTSFKRLFEGKSRHPRFKAKKHEWSYTINHVNNNIRLIDEHHIKLPKFGVVYYRAGRMPHGKIKSVTIRTKPSGKVIASVLCECNEQELPPTGKAIGIDMGLDDFAVLSDGTKFNMPRYDKESEKQLHYWQRLASRRLLKAKEAMAKDKTLRLNDFRNYQKARRMCAKIQEHIANQRTDYLQKLSTWLVKRFDVIVIEDLKAKGMMHNHRLSRAIANASWRAFREMLEYKCRFYGKTLVCVDPKYTSQTCHECGYVNGRLGYDAYGWLKVRDWDCPSCGTHHDRDVNAAINILTLGLI